MSERRYYSARTGKHPDGARLDLPALKRIFLSVERQFRDREYFQEAFGYHCVDAGDVPGSLGEDVEGVMLIAIRKENLWPLRNNIDRFTEDDLFDVIEFLFDHVSKPVDGCFHSYDGCGMHYSTFNRADGQSEFRTALNPILRSYSSGFELSDRGEILNLPEEGMSSLLQATLPPIDPNNIEGRIRAATDRFRRHGASLEDRKHALRDLADVLEFIRPRMKGVLSSSDESDLFNIANNFGIRHHNDKQKTAYDAAIWYSWMFYYYLATLHACIRLFQKHQDREHTAMADVKPRIDSTERTGRS